MPVGSFRVGEGNFTDFCTELQGTRKRSCAWPKAPMGGQHRQMGRAEDQTKCGGGMGRVCVLLETRGRRHRNPMRN